MLIGLAGRARSGKDTAAQYLSGYLGLDTYAFAEPIKSAIKTMFRLTDAHTEGELKEVDLPWLGRSPRFLMQTLGTEWGRNTVHADIWLKLADQKLRRTPGLIISDVRFNNEADWVRANHGVIVHVIRPDAKAINEHISEAGVDQHPDDIVLYNTSHLADYHEKLSILGALLRSRFTGLKTPSGIQLRAP